MEGCLTRENNPGRLLEHFMYLHWKAKLVIVQDVPKTLQSFDQCGMNMNVARLFKHIHTAKCIKETERRIIWRDVDMEENCDKMEFSLYGEEGGDLV